VTPTWSSSPWIRSWIGSVPTLRFQATIMPPNLQPVPDRQLPTAERLAQLHEALASAGDPHDVILEIGRIGDASSVSFLIEALRNLAKRPCRP
jgi:hypothetical protein